MQRIKIIHILHSVGGVDVSLRLILENIDSARFESIVIHGTGDTKIDFKDNLGNPIKEYKLPIQREISVLDDIRSIIKTAKILRSEKPNVIHAHSAKGGIIARSASIFFRRPVLHTPQAYSYLSEPKGFKRSVFLGIEKFFRGINSTLLASSNSERNRGVLEVKYKEENALTFNNSINSISSSEFMEPSIGLPASYICTVGRPSFQKNIEMMIEVIKALREKQPNVHLIIMGVGEYSPNKESVEQLISDYGLGKNITMIPWIERAKIFSIIKASQLYVSTARYEGLPYSIIEALALGKACVVTDCDGNRDLIEDGHNGYVVEENAVDTMANRIFALLKENEKREGFERNALKRFNENFNMTYNIEKLEKIYRDFSQK